MRGKWWLKDHWGTEEYLSLCTGKVLRQGRRFLEEGGSVGGQVGIKNCECVAAFCWQIIVFVLGGFSHSCEAFRCAFSLRNGWLPFWEVSATWGVAWTGVTFLFWGGKETTLFWEYPFLFIKTIPFPAFYYHFWAFWTIPFPDQALLLYWQGGSRAFGTGWCISIFRLKSINFLHIYNSLISKSYWQHGSAHHRGA